jgi:HlyD family secretion protein
MANLDSLQIQTMVGETDVGALLPGMNARVTVDAFPNRTFRGTVLKIEPQAVVQQSVTMFPVLVTIRNENGKLLPGMNGEVTIDIAHRSQVVAVPLDAVRSLRELPAVAATLGLDADTLRAQVQRQLATAATAAPAAAAAPATAIRGDTARSRRRGAGGGANGGAARGGGASASATQVVMVQTPGGFRAQVVRLGISDFDYAEVLSGVRTGDVVALLSVAEQAAKRKSTNADMAKRVGGAMTGAPSGGGRAGGGH